MRPNSLTRLTRRTFLLAGGAFLASLRLRADESSDPVLIERPAFPSRFVDARDIILWLPPGYESGARFPVLYMHDGQNLFLPRRAAYGMEWEMDEHMTALAGRGIRPAIIVGIGNTPKRTIEYAPATLIRHLSPELREELQKAYGGPPLSDKYLRFIVEELKPAIDREYRTLPGRDTTLIMGSSSGGQISLEALARYPQVFGGAGCVSVHLPLFIPPEIGNPKVPVPHEKEVEAALVAYARDLPRPGHNRLWLDHGTEQLDAAYAPYQDTLANALVKRGWRLGKDLESRTFQGATHNEKAWSGRVEQILMFLLRADARSQLPR